METSKPLQQQAYEHLKGLIYQDFFSYDQIYSETKVAKEMGISRTPMRDAIHRLSQERFLDIIPSKGFCLHQMNRQDIQETFQVRSAIEGYCTYLITKDFKMEPAKRAPAHNKIGKRFCLHRQCLSPGNCSICRESYFM